MASLEIKLEDFWVTLSLSNFFVTHGIFFLFLGTFKHIRHLYSFPQPGHLPQALSFPRGRELEAAVPEVSLSLPCQHLPPHP